MVRGSICVDVSSVIVVMVVVTLTLDWCMVVDGANILPPDGLTRHYYKKHNTCDDVEAYIQHEVQLFWKRDKSITPKLLRLLYSDCFVTGCDGSILLDGPDSEKTAPQNAGLGGFVVIDKIKEVLEKRCPGVVSCADILNLATRDAVHLAGAPSYPVLTGRRDGFSSKASSVDLPSPYITWNEALKYFKSRGLDVLDLTTLLGAHSTGKARCRYISDRLYNFKGTGMADPSMDSALVAQLRKVCPPKTPKGEHEALVYLNPDSGPKYELNNTYYSRILSHKAILEVDQSLFDGNDTMQITQEFAAGFEDLRKAFALSMARMGGINVLTGKQGEIRRNCSYTNKNNPFLK